MFLVHGAWVLQSFRYSHVRWLLMLTNLLMFLVHAFMTILKLMVSARDPHITWITTWVPGRRLRISTFNFWQTVWKIVPQIIIMICASWHSTHSLALADPSQWGRLVAFESFNMRRSKSVSTALGGQRWNSEGIGPQSCSQRSRMVILLLAQHYLLHTSQLHMATSTLNFSDWTWALGQLCSSQGDYSFVLPDSQILRLKTMRLDACVTFLHLKVTLQ